MIILIILILLFALFVIWLRLQTEPINETIINEDLLNLHCNYEKVTLSGLGKVEGRPYMLHKCEELILRNCSMNFIMNISKYFVTKKFIKKLIIEQPRQPFNSLTINTIKSVGELVFINVHEEDMKLIKEHIRTY